MRKPRHLNTQSQGDLDLPADKFPFQLVPPPKSLPKLPGIHFTRTHRPVHFLTTIVAPASRIACFLFATAFPGFMILITYRFRA